MEVKSLKAVNNKLELVEKASGISFDPTGTQFTTTTLQTLGVEIDSVIGDINTALDEINGEVV